MLNIHFALHFSVQVMCLIKVSIKDYWLSVQHIKLMLKFFKKYHLFVSLIVATH